MKNIKIIAPSSYVPDLTLEKLEGLKTLLNKMNLNFNYGKYIFEKKYFLAGTDEERLSDLTEAFSDPKIDFIVALRGGSGSIRLLDKINYNLISRSPKMLFGFSDTTALQTALYTKIGLPSFSGFLLSNIFKDLSPLTKKTFIKCLKNEKQTFKAPFISKGNASGTLLGGNLRVFVSLLGTPYFPDMKGKILILEDVGEAPYNIDNMIMQLKLAGVFKHIKGLILGDFSRLESKKSEKELNTLLKDHFSNMSYPVVRFKKYSHEKDHVVIPLGGIVHLNSKKGTITLDKLKKIK